MKLVANSRGAVGARDLGEVNAGGQSLEPDPGVINTLAGHDADLLAVGLEDLQLEKCPALGGVHEDTVVAAAEVAGLEPDPVGVAVELEGNIGVAPQHPQVERLGRCLVIGPVGGPDGWGEPCFKDFQLG